MKVYIIAAILFVIGLALILIGIFAAPGKANATTIAEEVYEFGEWYGIVIYANGKAVGREITVFSHSNDASLSLKLGKKEELLIEISAGWQSAKTDREIVIFIDDGEGITEVNKKLVRGFKKGYVAEIHFTDSKNVQRKELFSLRGFSRAYRWLTK